TTTYQLTVVDSFGCVVEERITVNVRKERRVFIPSAFSPNGDGINERFTVYAGPEVAEIKSFRVFDRWGELVFERVGFLPNQELEGWDGRLGGQLMDNGVYIYYAEIRFVDGWEELHQGDVTLVR
ncbi:MAG: gliding motility-associated C-terminal domain-containing protein, partial [Bacteroidota bacterium]